MPEEPSRLDNTQRIHAMQIIAVALINGVIFFGIVAVIFTWGSPPGEAIFAYVGGIMALAAVAAWAIVPTVIVKNMCGVVSRETSASRSENWERELRLLGAYQTGLIVGLALLEGGAFANLVFYITAHHWLSVAVAAALVLFMLAAFPTRNKVESWVEHQKELMELEHHS